MPSLAAARRGKTHCKMPSTRLTHSVNQAIGRATGAADWIPPVYIASLVYREDRGRRLVEHYKLITLHDSSKAPAAFLLACADCVILHSHLETWDM